MCILTNPTIRPIYEDTHTLTKEILTNATIRPKRLCTGNACKVKHTALSRLQSTRQACGAITLLPPWSRYLGHCWSTWAVERTVTLFPWIRIATLAWCRGREVAARQHLVVGVVVLGRGLLAPRLVPVGSHREPVVPVRDGAVTRVMVRVMVMVRVRVRVRVRARVRVGAGASDRVPVMSIH
eukprot:scaffold106388_cov57-Phaeocystis_antarctica.AAC.3